MSRLRKKLIKEVSEIDKTITNEAEKTKVMDIIQEMIKDFTEYIVELTERQNELEAEVSEIYDVLTNIEDVLADAIMARGEANCPYCGELIPVEFKDEEDTEFECPNCHNVIELETLFDEHECGCEDCEECEDDEIDLCSGHCGHCGGCCDDEEEDDDEE